MFHFIPSARTLETVIFLLVVSWVQVLAPQPGYTQALDARTLPAYAPVSRPVLGYVSSSPSELRPILGVPGAAMFGAPMILPDGVIKIHVAPSHTYALVERSNQEIAMIRLNGLEAGRAVSIGGVPSSPEILAFSPSGTAALLGSLKQRRLYAVSGLPDEPRIAQDLDVGTLAAPNAVAVSDDATSILHSSASGVYLLSAGGTKTVASSAVASLAFIPRSNGAVIGDQTSGVVSIIRPEDRATGGKLVLAAVTKIGKMSVSADGSNLYICDSASPHIHSVDIRTGAASRFELPVSPSRLDRLGRPDAFLVSADADQPAWLVVGAGSEPRAVFVPAPPPTTRQKHAPEDSKVGYR